MSPQSLEKMVPDEAESNMISHVRSSSRPPSVHIPTPSRMSTAVNSANSASPAMQAHHLSESGLRMGEMQSSAQPSLVHRSHATSLRSLHAAKHSALEIQTSSGQTTPSSPSLSSLQTVPANFPHVVASNSIAQSGALPVHPRSTRRQPASRSSHGIETSTGPPPALSTQRSYTSEITRRRPAPADPAVSRPSLRGRSQTDSRLDPKALRRNLSADDPTRASLCQRPSIERRRTEIVKGNMSSTSASHQLHDDDTDRTLSGSRSNDPSPILSSAGEAALQRDERLHSSQEDERTTSNEEDEHIKSAEEDEHPISPEQDNHCKSSHEGDDPESLQEGDVPKSLPGDDRSKSSQEDLFLNLAKSDIQTDDVADRFNRRNSRGERSRSRVSNSTSNQSSTPQQSAGRPSSSGSRLQRHSVSSRENSSHLPWSPSRPFQDFNRPASLRNLSPRDRQYAASSHPLDTGIGDHHSTLSGNSSLTMMSRVRSGSNQETQSDRRGSYGGRQSIQEPSPVSASRVYKQSNLSHSTTDRDQPSPHPRALGLNLGGQKMLRPYQAEGSASTVSTTAPSTIWDSLEDLKHRIRNLGKLSTSSGVGERPMTGSTTTTTMSTSPKRDEPTHPYTTRETQIHPLLRAALATSRSTMEPRFYQVLEASISDALTLAAMTGSTVGLESHRPPSTIWEGRHLRSKADSLCRSLTALCLAFSDGQPEGTDVPVEGLSTDEDGSITLYQGVEDIRGPMYPRASSEDPEIRSSPGVNSRMEARRRSMVVFSNNRSRQEKPSPFTTPTHVSIPKANRSDHASLLMRRRERNEERQSDIDHHQNEPRYDDPRYHNYPFNGPRYSDLRYSEFPYSEPRPSQPRYSDRYGNNPFYGDQRHHDHQSYSDYHHDDYHFVNHHFNDYQYNDHYHGRPVSRAATEIGPYYRPSPTSRGSQEYPPQHHAPRLPPPSSHHGRSPSIQSSASRRRSHFPPSPQSPHSQPMSPTVFLSKRQHRDSHPPPPATAEDAQLTDMRQWRMQSLGVSEDDESEDDQKRTMMMQQRQHDEDISEQDEAEAIVEQDPGSGNGSEAEAEDGSLGLDEGEIMEQHEGRMEELDQEIMT